MTREVGQWGERYLLRSDDVCQTSLIVLRPRGAFHQERGSDRWRIVTVLRGRVSIATDAKQFTCPADDETVIAPGGAVTYRAGDRECELIEEACHIERMA